MPSFCSDRDLGYLENRRRFPADTPLTLDETYRFAHLPLVEPDHPDVIDHEPVRGYRMGRHRTVRSLVLPVRYEALSTSPAFDAMLMELKSGPLATKIAWDAFDARTDRLHATLCGELAGPAFDRIPCDARELLAAIGPVACEVRGLFVGTKNIGRIYLRVYPETRAGENVFHTVQGALNYSKTGLFLIGLINLKDHLSADEAGVLGEIIDRTWERTFARLTIDRLLVQESRDDLVLDASAYEVIPLHTAGSVSG